ncbi:MAG: restriction endonuclease subunit S [Gemmatimonadetes bacterium]|nr:restriction endonuclease subunit S [Gemmatimonadota bacterium]
MSFRKYETYKESGVEWLGEIPAGWTTQKLKFVARVQPSNVDKKSKKDEKEVQLCNYTDVYYNEEITADLPFMKATASDVQIKKFTLKRGDTIITKDSEDPNDIAVPAYVPQDLDGVVCGYHLALLRPEKGTCGGYLKRVMDTQYARSAFATRANGITRYGLGTYAISNFILPFPPLEEQKQIAAFLDKETTKIDTLIDKQEQLITLLQEKRQAIISHAVTRGLNPNVKMKDSGIEWLGKMPAHWEVKKLKHVVTKPLMYGANEAAIDDDRDQPRFVRITDIRNNGTLREDTFRSLPWHLAKPYMLREGDVLLARSGATVGKSFIYSSDWGECCFAGYLIKASIDISKASPHWFYLYTESDYYWNWISSTLIQATIQNVSAEKYNNFSLCIPPKQEQNRIIAYLDKETAKIDTLIEKCETAIELLKERRTALISAAVTGKIDVRNVG